MSIIFRMPALSPTMTQGDIVKWEKSLGDPIENGDTLLAIETDKAIMDFEATDSGELFHILVPDGTKGVLVGTPLAIFKESQDVLHDLNALVKSLGSAFDANRLKDLSAPSDKQTSEKKIGPDFCEEKSSTPFRVSPLAKKIAELHHIDLNQCLGTGPEGRIVKADIDREIKKKPVTNTLEDLKNTQILEKCSKERDNVLSGGMFVPFSGMRGVIAKRLTQSKQEIPHFYMSLSCKMDALLDLRKTLNHTHSEMRVSVNDFILKATALTLKTFPEMNAHASLQGITKFEKVRLAFAVSLEKGLITPIIEDAAEQSLFKLSNTVKKLVERARSGELALQEYQNGTFTVSNLGMFQIEDFQAIINPPQVGILATSATLEKPIVEKQSIVIAKIMNVALSADHRAVDGVLAAQFIRKFQYYIEHPLMLLAE
ncbi:dihydrolipoyllysine-residue acetyltransferase component of pyruvate dehydrogenase complex [Holospora obtusa F1]|uniref:Dihydrolipoamide acetyltransferase component of pyruvate dehydrogenase complex n=1 Tax=Holospora obtusa F1 TaxID=1399147 RepID=W6TDN0_HOLOB|nr:dihydrolipoamide acetyltransferase family protein [Holospora obtusa]ETZ06856.1 dihydrolipoyllysine-residue acetyltransferase component of pyruvate dehydrogenase complex [Holospora obtusa F1]